MKQIDLRSDTVTKPCEAMKKAMMSAELGDDVYMEDSTVNKLEKMLAQIMGKQAGLFVPSGTQSNLIALLTHLNRGEEYLAGQKAHLYKYEAGGAAVLGGIQPQPVELLPNGTFDLNKLEEYIKPDNLHFAITKLLCIENTFWGKALPLDYLDDVRNFAKKHSLKLHFDGARIFNASVKLNVDPKDLTKGFDSVSVCLSKGLGTPVGSVLCGNKEFIDKARRYRKMLGGGMRQAGILAAAGIFALENNVERLKEDHENAAFLTNELSKIDLLNVEKYELQTNMVFFEIDEKYIEPLSNFMKERNILMSIEPKTRIVLHKDISKEDVNFIIKSFNKFFNS